MRFLDIIQTKLSTLEEQVPGEVPAFDPAAAMAASAPGAAAPAPAPAPTAQAEPTADAETKKPLTPEGEVFLVRLLKKALFMNPGELDEKLLSELPEINENNAADVLTKIVEIMKKYSSNIDVET